MVLICSSKQNSYRDKKRLSRLAIKIGHFLNFESCAAYRNNSVVRYSCHQAAATQTTLRMSRSRRARLLQAAAARPRSTGRTQKSKIRSASEFLKTPPEPENTNINSSKTRQQMFKRSAASTVQNFPFTADNKGSWPLKRSRGQIGYASKASAKQKFVASRNTTSQALGKIAHLPTHRSREFKRSDAHLKCDTLTRDSNFKRQILVSSQRVLVNEARAASNAKTDLDGLPEEAATKTGTRSPSKLKHCSQVWTPKTQKSTPPSKKLPDKVGMEAKTSFAQLAVSATETAIAPLVTPTENHTQCVKAMVNGNPNQDGQKCTSQTNQPMQSFVARHVGDDRCPTHARVSSVTAVTPASSIEIDGKQSLEGNVDTTDDKGVEFALCRCSCHPSLLFNSQLNFKYSLAKKLRIQPCISRLSPARL